MTLALIATLIAPQVASCSPQATPEPAISEREACERARAAVARRDAYEKSAIAGCDYSVADNMPNLHVLRLNAFCHEELCGSVLLGWFAVDKDSGQVFEWNVADWTLGEELAT